MTKKPGDRPKFRLVKASDSENQLATNSLPSPSTNGIGRSTKEHALKDLRANFKELTQVQARLKFLLHELEELL